MGAGYDMLSIVDIICFIALFIYLFIYLLLAAHDAGTGPDKIFKQLFRNSCSNLDYDQFVF